MTVPRVTAAMMGPASIHVDGFIISHLICVSHREDTAVQPLIKLVFFFPPVATNSHTPPAK